MPYDAFTVDTNTLIQSGLQLQSGLIGQLQQFKNGPVQFILSEIVTRELNKHLSKQTSEAHDGFHKALAKTIKAGLIDADQLAAWNSKADELPEAQLLAKTRLIAFVESTGANVVKADVASIPDLLAAYFGNSAPFETTGAKKNEFPDAIALLSMEAWAKKTGKRVLAVSSDKGWIEFGQKSEVIDVLDDLAQALGVVQQHSEQAEAAVTEWLNKLAERPDQQAALAEMLNASLSDTSFFPDGSGGFHLEGESEGLELVSYDLNPRDGEYDLDVVRLGSSEVSAALTLTVTANAHASFSLSVWDSIDREYVSMGSQSAQREWEFDCTALITLSGEANQTERPLELSDIEVVDGPDIIDFGEIEFEPDYEDVGYEDWIASKPLPEDKP